jgi:filamentous hemagglutinin
MTKVYSTLAGYVDAAANFNEYSLSDVELNQSMIQARQVQVAVPAQTTPQQWQQIEQAVQYGQSKGIQVIVTPVQ